MKPIIFHDFTDSQNVNLQDRKWFFQQYFKNFETEEHFQKSIAAIEVTPEKNLTRQCIEVLRENISSLKNALNDLGLDKEFPEVVFMSGGGSWDGHGMLVDSRAIVFFDMQRMVRWIATANFAIKTHIAHEIIHAIHYRRSPAFYLGNYSTVDDEIIKRMFAEGLGTHLSSKITGVPLHRALWLGLLDDSTSLQWCERGDQMRLQVAESFRRVLETGTDPDRLAETLFTVPGITQGELLRGRFGYYFGAKIVESLQTGRSDFHLLEMPFNEVKQKMLDYFFGA